MATASTLPALNASILGTYSNHLKSTLTPAASNQPFFKPTSHATQPGQSLYAIVSAGPLAAGALVVAVPGVAAGCGLASLPGFGASALQAGNTALASTNNKPRPTRRNEPAAGGVATCAATALTRGEIEPEVCIETYVPSHRFRDISEPANGPGMTNERSFV